MKRLERLTALLSLLQSRRYTLISDIEAKFEVSERTVFRDIRALEESGVPIGHEKNKGYYILQGHFIPPLAFTLDEAKSFIFVEQLARKYTDKETYTRFSSALEKIRNALKNSQLEEIEGLGEKVDAYIGRGEPHKYLSMVEQACSKKQVLHIDYQDVKGLKTSRTIEPIGITFYNQSWHVIAYCRLRSDYRDFSLVRMLDIRTTNDSFSKEHISLAQYITNLQTAHLT